MSAALDKSSAFARLVQRRFPKNHPAVIVGWIFLVLGLYAYFLSLGLQEIHKPLYYDESQWIFVSQKYFSHILKRDFKNPDWKESFSTFGKNNPKIAQYLMGLTLYLSGELATSFNAMYWDWEHDLEWNDAAGNAPPLRTLFYARIVMPFLGAGCGLLFFFMLTRVLHWLPSFLAACFLGSNRLLVIYSARAMQDTPAIFFCLVFLAVIFSLPFREAMDKSLLKLLAYSALAGISLGLAVGTKLNNLALVGIFGLFICWITLFVSPARAGFRLKRFWRLFCSSAIGFLLCAGVMVASNPYLYAKQPRHFFKRAKSLYELNRIVKDYAQGDFSQDAFYSYSDKVRCLFYYIFKQYYPHKAGMWAAVLGLGLVYMFYRFWHSAREGINRETDLLFLSLLVVLVIFLANFFWIPLCWDRFFLPFLIPLGLLVGFFWHLAMRAGFTIFQKGLYPYLFPALQAPGMHSPGIDVK